MIIGYYRIPLIVIDFLCLKGKIGYDCIRILNQQSAKILLPWDTELYLSLLLLFM